MQYIVKAIYTFQFFKSIKRRLSGDIRHIIVRTFNVDYLGHVRQLLMTALSGALASFAGRRPFLSRKLGATFRDRRC